MAATDLDTWMDEFARPGTVWYAKRLSGNDTLANDTNQAGPYIPRDFLFEIFPSLNRPEKLNPDHTVDVYVDSHADHRKVRVIWYNNKLHPDPKPRPGKKKIRRNETRITNWGGQESALLNADSTGSIAVFVFVLNGGGDAKECHVWVCDSAVEEDTIEARIGPVEPKLFVIWRPGTYVPDLFAPPPGPRSCRLKREQIPPTWLSTFPTGQEIVTKTRELRPDRNDSIDDRLLSRRDCEFEIFKSVEEAVYLPKMGNGFSSIESFISLAQTILQSRKSRAGTSLELHTRDIFIEEKLVLDKHFSHRPVIEVNKRPDFLFPSTAAYNDANFPAAGLRMLAAKTTCKERWPQVLNEATRIPVKHLLTLQEGVSENQFDEMTKAGVKLVVPAGLHGKFPKRVQPHLVTLEAFIGEVRTLAAQR